MGKSGPKWGKGGKDMFLGHYEHMLDEKGRLSLPVKLREKLGPNFIITKGLDRCLFIYPLKEWENIEVRLRELSTTKSDARSFARMFFAGAAECECDKQGRITIPPSLRDHALLIKDAVIVGVGSRVEVWSSDKWREYSEQALENYEKIAEDLEAIL